MHTLVTRQRLVRSAALAASGVFLAACGNVQHAVKVDPSSPTPTPTPPAASLPRLTAGALLVSNGTNIVSVAGTAVTFPTTVTDAAWSPDGSRIAFVDADGNISTARPDGTGRRVLTAARTGMTRSHPAWWGTSVVFAEKRAGHASDLMSVRSDVTDRQAYDYAQDPEGDDSAPSTASQIGVGWTMAWQRQGPQGPEVFVIDANQREQLTHEIAPGSQPALSPDRTRVAYIAPNGQVTVAARSAKPVQTTFGVAKPSHPVWSPDGQRVTFATATDVESVSSTVATGAKANPTTPVSPIPGVPTYLGPPRDVVTRIAGTDPVAGSIGLSRARWTTRGTFDHSESSDYADSAILVPVANPSVALAGAILTQGPSGPVLSTGSALDQRTEAELKRIFGKVQGPDGPRPLVTIVGGTDLISTGAGNRLTALGYEVNRVVAADQYAVAAAMSRNPATDSRVMVVDGEDPAAMVTTRFETVLLSHGSTMPAWAKSYLKALNKDAQVYAVGAAAQAAVASSWSGTPTKLATVVEQITTSREAADRVIIVDRSTPSDVVLAAGLVRSYWFALVLIVDGKAGLDPGLQTWLDAASASIDSAVIVDSSSAVSPSLEAAVGTALSGPLGYRTASSLPPAS